MELALRLERGRQRHWLAGETNLSPNLSSLTIAQPVPSPLPSLPRVGQRLPIAALAPYPSCGVWGVSYPPWFEPTFAVRIAQNERGGLAAMCMPSYRLRHAGDVLGGLESL